MPKLRITYNAPVVLTFAIVAVIVQFLPVSLRSWFVAQPTFSNGAHSWVGMFTYIFGHISWEHLVGNFMLILLVGPILEERHGSVALLAMIAVTAVVGGVANAAFTNHALIGASGVAFMMILLASTANMRSGDIPLTFIAVAFIYLGREIVEAVRDTDQVSHLTHLAGGLAGAAFGFLAAPAKRRVPSAAITRPLIPVEKVRPKTNP